MGLTRCWHAASALLVLCAGDRQEACCCGPDCDEACRAIHEGLEDVCTTLPLAACQAQQACHWGRQPGCDDCRGDCRRKYLEDFDEFRRKSASAFLIASGYGGSKEGSFAGFTEREEALAEVGGLHSHRQHTSWDVSSVSDSALLITDASTKVLACWGSAGRYWHGEVQTALGPRRSTLCVPRSCTQEDVEAALLPIWFQRFMGVESFEARQMTSQELSHWADLPLDFAIMGLDGCGTTSLRHNLAKHPEINFTALSIHNKDEDFFVMEMGRQTLPLMSQVQRLALHRGAMAKVKRLGIYQPVMWSEEVMEHVLSLIPEMRIVVAVCDPVDRFERKLHLENELDEADLQELLLRKLEDKRGYLYFGAALASIKSTFGHRLLVVEKEELHHHKTYERVAHFLGLGPFPSRARLKRYNSRGQQRSGLCSQPLLIDELKRVMSREYDVLEALLEHPSEQLRRRLPRCATAGPSEENLKLHHWRS